MNQLDLYNCWTLPLRIQRKLWPFSLEKCTPNLPHKVLRVPRTPYASQGPPPLQCVCMAPRSLCRSWTSTGTSMGGSELPNCWAWIWPLWKSQSTMSASLNHHRGCLPGAPGVAPHRPGAGRGIGQGWTLRHLAIPLLSTLHRLMSIDIKYQIWKFGVIFTDNVRRGQYWGRDLQENGSTPRYPWPGTDS